jgi:hypothetical protein
MARDLVNSLYRATFDGQADYASFDAYLFSFSHILRIQILIGNMASEPSGKSSRR